MAGAGYKLFNTGDVLTAAQVNTYLQEQVVMVFANAAARTTALSGVLAEGMVTYLKDTDALEIYSGTAWVGYGSGDITGVTAGTGLTGGGTSGSVTVSLTVPVVESSGGTNQTTYTTGDILYASASNTLSKRAVGTTGQVLTVSGGVPTWATPSSGSTFKGALVGSTTDQSTSTGTITVLNWDTETFDTDSFHNNSTNNSRLTIPTTGYYLVYSMVRWDTSGTGYRYVGFRKNGNSATDTISPPNFNPGSGGNGWHISSIVMSLTAADYVEAVTVQTSGGNLNARNSLSFFGISYLGA